MKHSNNTTGNGTSAVPQPTVPQRALSTALNNRRITE